MTNYEKLTVIKKDISILEERVVAAEKAFNWSFVRREFDFAILELKELNDLSKQLDSKRTERDRLQILVDDERHSEAVGAIS